MRCGDSRRCEGGNRLLRGRENTAWRRCWRDGVCVWLFFELAMAAEPSVASARAGDPLGCPKGPIRAVSRPVLGPDPPRGRRCRRGFSRSIGTAGATEDSLAGCCSRSSSMICSAITPRPFQPPSSYPNPLFPNVLAGFFTAPQRRGPTHHRPPKKVPHLNDPAQPVPTPA